MLKLRINPIVVRDLKNIRVQITLKRNASSATAELLFHF